MRERETFVDHYGAQCGHFASELYAEIRAATFGEDIGQNGSTFEGQQRFFEVAARLAAERRLSRFAFHARRTR